ncbi:MAG TPA: SMC-Scp complex subunit ScpB [Lachnospiraceae bacterium]|jgi:segregation and condensation protein B|nr:SMC-Scp complex subunit ScpB [Lachnospiraceae bacterium]HBE07770.1 SMC-Scp complex subunit ScpB [Lachnospiraceae bacterium]
MENQNIISGIEGILFAMGDAVTVEELSKALDLPAEECKAIVESLAQQYKEENRGIQIIKINDGYQMCTSKEVYEYLIKLAKQPKKYVLTEVLLETLSIVAYKQPVTKAEIEKIRGVSSDHAVNRLVEFGLVQELGRLDAPGRPMLFGTTDDFLRAFGISSVEELPVLNATQLEEFKMEAEEEAEESLFNANPMDNE